MSLFHRTSRIDYNPDPIGDGLQRRRLHIMRSNRAYGMQADASYALNGSHTLRSGLFVQYEHAIVNNTSSVFPADADGNQTSSAPFSITDNGTLGGTTMGFYLRTSGKPPTS